MFSIVSDLLGMLPSGPDGPFVVVAFANKTTSRLGRPWYQHWFGRGLW